MDFRYARVTIEGARVTEEEAIETTEVQYAKVTMEEAGVAAMTSSSQATEIHYCPRHPRVAGIHKLQSRRYGLPLRESDEKGGESDGGRG